MDQRSEQMERNQLIESQSRISPYTLHRETHRTKEGEIRQEYDYFTWKERTYPLGRDAATPFLTKTAWDILRTVPSEIQPVLLAKLRIRSSEYFSTFSTEKVSLDKKGRWRTEAKPLDTDVNTLKKMQQLIQQFVAEEVARGAMSQDILATVDGIIEYKHGTLEPWALGRAPDGVMYSDEVIYRIKEKPRPVTIPTPGGLVGKIIEAKREDPEKDAVAVSGQDIEGYLRTKQFPHGAHLKSLKIEARNSIGTIQGNINVPIPFVGGDVLFRLDIENNHDKSGLVVKNHSIHSTSGTIQGRLGEISPYLTQINKLILDDLN